MADNSVLPLATEHKACIACGASLPATLEFFGPHNLKKDGLHGRCRACHKAYRQRWADAHPEAMVQSRRRWVVENRAKNNANANRWRGANKERLAKERAERRAKDPEPSRQKLREYRAANPGAAKEYAKRARAKRMATAEGKINERMARSLRLSLEANDLSKAGRAWSSLLGYSATDLARHLERQFLKGMSWESAGLWHIDHVTPLRLFRFSSVDDQEFKAAWALSNLRPLWKRDNLMKSGKRTHLL